MEPGQPEREGDSGAVIEQELKDLVDRLELDSKSLVLPQARWFASENAELLFESAQALADSSQIEAQLRWILAENPQLPPINDSQLGEAKALRVTLATLAASKIEDRYKHLPTVKTNKGIELTAPQLIDGIVSALAKKAATN